MSFSGCLLELIGFVPVVLIVWRGTLAFSKLLDFLPSFMMWGLSVLAMLLSVGGAAILFMLPIRLLENKETNEPIISKEKYETVGVILKVLSGIFMLIFFEIVIWKAS